MSDLALGLMSGTSADGVSAALGSFHDHSFKLLGWVNVPYSPEMAERVRRGPSLSAAEVSRLNVDLGEMFALAANRVLRKTHVSPSKVACIGSHGQTIYHGPQDGTPNTFQIADPATIAERTGITVVSHFRQRDIAAGGQGAPLIPYFDQFFFGNGPVRALLNIGGVANVTVVGRGVKDPLAFDTGPGNALIDRAVRIISNGAEEFDQNGQRAKRGKLDMETISRMMEDDYFQLPPPKSTGPERFGDAFLQRHVPWLKERPDDAVATLSYFTCLTVQESFRRSIFEMYPITDIIVSGGGAHNKWLMKKMECLFAPIPVTSIEAHHLPAQAKEPLAFAFFGLRCLNNKPNHLPSGTGAKKQVILGSITRA